MSTPPTLSAKEAAAELGVSLATLYAYVSRGLIRSEPSSGGRTRLYRADDVRALVARRDRPAETSGERALDWGAPVLESAITLITGNRLYYRGRDVADLAAGSSVESVAGLLWDVTDDPFAEDPPDPPPLIGLPSDLDPLDRLLAVLPLAAVGDRRAVNRTPAGLARTGARILRLTSAILAGTVPSAQPLHQQLCTAWDVSGAGAELIRATLVLCADHELNASAFTVRCVASTGASPYAAISAGIGALRGPRHGGMTARLAAVLPGLLDAPDPAAALSAFLARGEELPAFGHPLYPQGDVRATWLLKRMAASWGGDARMRRALALARAATDLAGTPPTIDFALVLLADRLGLPPHAPLTLFTLGRSAGWMAHYLEQARSGVLIRPRARYTGLRPA
ncbi:citrate synthase family protein [Niveispirillum sp.]|uniref:citrate synthase family protein n=1 Tax=Niveispirillum sp. TaxID=1917217 RepID=UPI001B5D63C3|nr:citrate synthase family protein [Niveispirillum sp.]MBP7335154.1 citrate synthase family protein [Niveispirillum sp.]